MNDNIAKAYTELYEILRFIPKDRYNKIDKKFLEDIEEQRDKNYNYKVEHIIDFENQPMLEETRALIAIVYKDYLATEEERNEFIKELRIKEAKIEDEKRLKYSVDVFENKRKKENKTEENYIVKFKDKNFFEKIIDFFKRLLSM